VKSGVREFFEGLFGVFVVVISGVEAALSVDGVVFSLGVGASEDWDEGLFVLVGLVGSGVGVICEGVFDRLVFGESGIGVVSGVEELVDLVLFGVVGSVVTMLEGLCDLVVVSVGVAFGVFDFFVFGVAGSVGVTSTGVSDVGVAVSWGWVGMTVSFGLVGAAVSWCWVAAAFDGVGVVSGAGVVAECLVLVLGGEGHCVGLLCSGVALGVRAREALGVLVSGSGVGSGVLVSGGGLDLGGPRDLVVFGVSGATFAGLVGGSIGVTVSVVILGVRVALGVLVSRRGKE
jgi:hypothetical protein